MKRRDRLVGRAPENAIAPLAAVALVHLAAYYLPRFLHRAAPRNFALPIDRAIPFVPAFIAIYLLAYVQWVAGYLLLVREDRELLRRTAAGAILATLICMALFVLVPTTMARGQIRGSDGFSRLTAWIYRVDAPDNLFPSLHCVESWICLRAAGRMKRAGRGYRWFSWIFTPLVLASTLLVKQHVVVDVAAGLAVAELGQQIAWRAGDLPLLRGRK